MTERKIELPKLDVTEEDHAKYDAEWEIRWDGYPVDSICAQLNCRERQLLAALTKIADMEALLRDMRDGHINSATSWPCSKTPNTDTRCEWCKRVDALLAEGL